MSEAQKKAKLLERETHEKAMKTLNDMINDNNGIKGTHFVKDVASTYNIDRNVLYYRLSCQGKRNAPVAETPNRIHNGTVTITPNTGNSTGHATAVEDRMDTQNNTTMNTHNASFTRQALARFSGSLTTGSSTSTISRKQKKIYEQTQKALIAEATTLAAQQYSDARKNISIGGTSSKVKIGTLKKIISAVEEEKNIEPGTVNANCIQSRVRRNNITGFNPQSTSPLHLIEPFLAELCVRVSRMGTSLTKKTVIQLCSELIQNTEHATNYAKCIGKAMDNQQATITPGDRWYTNFMKRYSYKLKSTASNIMDSNRKTFCVKENFKRMYDSVYDEMTKAGVAEKLDEEIMLDKNGDQVFSEDLMYGLPTRYKMKHPNYVLFMDETGCNTNQKKDGKVGGERYVLPVDGSGIGAIGSTTDLHFSCACFTSGSGAPVMCAIIFASEKPAKEIPMAWKTGIDRRIDIKGHTFDMDFIEEHTKSSGALAGGPKCSHNGKEIPCFYGASPHGGITGQMLADMLKFLDERNVYERSDNLKPFLLLDGHNSRFSLEFLSYINDEAHEWVVCIGVPYGTHIWQVADSCELNGTMKIFLTIAKREYLKFLRGGRTTFSPRDICPLVRSAWEASYAKTEFGQKAIAERGWGPLNYVLLNHPQLQAPTPSTNAATEEVEQESFVHMDEEFIMIRRVGPSIEKIADAVFTRFKNDEGCARAFVQRKANEVEYENGYKRLQDIGRLSSGTLTANNHFSLNKELLLEALKRKEKEDASEQEKKERKNRRCQVLQEKFIHSRTLFLSNSSKMKVDDYRVLINSTRSANESPAKKTLAAMKVQFHDRDCQLRLNSISNLHGMPAEAEDTTVENSIELTTLHTFDNEFDNLSMAEDFDEIVNNLFNEESIQFNI